MSIDTFQARFAFVNLDDGTLTPEAFRVLRTWFTRIGGFNSSSNEDLAQLVLQALGTIIVDSAARAGLADIELGQGVDQSALIANMAQRIDELQLLASTVNSLAAEVASLRQRAADIEQLASHRDPFRVDWERPGKVGSLTSNTGAFTTISATGQITSTLAIGTAPLVITSTTKVTNLNADMLDGGDWAAPGAIGTTTRNSAAFTTVSASGGLTTGIATALVASSVALNNGAAAAAGTLANAPAAGNPTKWIPINDNGTTRYMPAW